VGDRAEIGQNRLAARAMRGQFQQIERMLGRGFSMPIPAINGLLPAFSGLLPAISGFLPGVEGLLPAIGGLGGGGGLQNLIPGAGAPVTVTHTPDGSNVETIAIDLPGTTGEIEYMDDGGVPPLLQLGGEAGDQNVGDGFGGRSVESVGVDGPLDIGLNALFGLQDSESTESSADVGGGLLTAAPSQGLAPSSLESAGATGPLGIDLDLLMQNSTGSALTSDVSVSDDEAFSGQLLGGPGGRIDTLTLQGPLEAAIATEDGGEAGFPLQVGDDSLVGASLFDNLANTGLETFDVGFGSIPGLDTASTGAFDELLDGLFS
jgi:hypothetical protein